MRLAIEALHDASEAPSFAHAPKRGATDPPSAAREAKSRDTEAISPACNNFQIACRTNRFAPSLVGRTLVRPTREVQPTDVGLKSDPQGELRVTLWVGL